MGLVCIPGCPISLECAPFFKSHILSWKKYLASEKITEWTLRFPSLEIKTVKTPAAAPVPINPNPRAYVYRLLGRLHQIQANVRVCIFPCSSSFAEKEMLLAHKIMGGCSMSRMLREMQTKTAMKYPCGKPDQLAFYANFVRLCSFR